jgi:CheY-like chemotaxis protein
MPSVLVVDDNAAMRKLATLLVETRGYHVESAANGADALMAMQRQVPDLVILDLHMPVMDGPAFVEEVRARGLRPKLLVYTADVDAALWAARLEADGWLVKSGDPLALPDKVSQLCPPDALPRAA